MKIYLPNDENNNPVILHFGIGLIGHAIRNTILSPATNSYNYREKNVKFSWTLELLSQEMDKIFETIPDGRQICFIWSAGKAGFSASESEVESEFHLFSAFINELRDRLNDMSVKSHFILLSSAGGLYEGQRNVHGESHPYPLRPYGTLKLKQEIFVVTHLSEITTISILRPSTVYSQQLSASRQGLIQVLINNALKHQLSNIYAQQTTLRDYILDVDIAKFLSRLIFMEYLGGAKTYHLVSGRPYSIFEIIQLISKKINQGLYVSYSSEILNSRDITFSPSIMPKGFQPTDLSASIDSIIYENLN